MRSVRGKILLLVGLLLTALSIWRRPSPALAAQAAGASWRFLDFAADRCVRGNRACCCALARHPAME